MVASLIWFPPLRKKDYINPSETKVNRILTQDVDASSDLGKHQDTHKNMRPEQPSGYSTASQNIFAEPPPPVRVEKDTVSGHSHSPASSIQNVRHFLFKLFLGLRVDPASYRRREEEEEYFQIS